MIEGVPGTAKATYREDTRAHALTPTGHINITDLMRFGHHRHQRLNVATSTFNLRQDHVFTDILLVEEINRTAAKTQAALKRWKNDRRRLTVMIATARRSLLCWQRRTDRE